MARAGETLTMPMFVAYGHNDVTTPEKDLEIIQIAATLMVVEAHQVQIILGTAGAIIIYEGFE